MMRIVLPLLGTVAAWRDHVRRLAAEGVAPEAVRWTVGEEARDLLTVDLPPVPSRQLKIARDALEEIETALCHSDPERFNRAHALVLRLNDGLAWGDRTNPALRKLMEQAKTVRRDIHKMHAFVRFREVPTEGPRRAFAAWFEPDHHIVERGTPFFAKRFADMDWVIATPAVTARFDGTLHFEETADTARPPPDATEDLWRTYYASIFNPGRVMVKAMQSEMPKKYWKNLPEADLIPDLIRGADARVREMQAREAEEAPERRRAVARSMAMPERPEPEAGTLDALRAQAAACTRCPLYAPATQTVFGEGPRDAKIMVVGEQPGDQEDLAGRPFVGPAGKLFDEEAEAAGLDRRQVYVTNAVKHFKFTPRGKRRIHQSPVAGEIRACQTWLQHEMGLIRPQLIVSMGATALQSLTGKGAGILKRRGGIEEAGDGTPILVTVHPSYLLRLPDPELARVERAKFREDLARAATYL
ncbi:UdgX family uracil-DNA binding protein [Falsirhodobacter sp. 20TX0035]|uniref:UdgX family uracil-DNA binding protein n=1 Tax=Falsirhodobacter sp. 20TX0035 TaxID=3022019 RepID=UPI00232A939D|nr:UdgX family uracil-DNA binding protein [Falsirhodobacter sp. 20TX0035]MDB6452400.1 UdgX family uracil-DNA binding protein [Falsirhodobacter sp. 20TX0035]